MLSSSSPRVVHSESISQMPGWSMCVRREGNSSSSSSSSSNDNQENDGVGVGSFFSPLLLRRWLRRHRHRPSRRRRQPPSVPTGRCHQENNSNPHTEPTESKTTTTTAPSGTSSTALFFPSFQSSTKIIAVVGVWLVDVERRCCCDNVFCCRWWLSCNLSR